MKISRFFSRSWLLSLLALVMFACIVMLLHKRSAIQQVAQAASAMTVTSAKAEEAIWPKTVDASGPVTAWQEAIIGSQITGQRLIEVLVDVGDTVKKGQVLARYNADMLLAQKAELEANWVQADADRKRALKLQKSGVMSTQVIESYVNKAAVAKARLDAKNLELKYAAIVSPEDGVISSRSATIGEVGNAGTELFRLIVQNRFEWRGELTAEQLRDITIGQKVILTLPDESRAEATIRQISPSFNTQSRMVTVYADILPGSHAHAGMYADGRIELGDKQVVTVPADSVVIRDGYNYVFRLPLQTGTMKVGRQQVTTGQHVGDKIEIISGLKPGDLIAAKGAGFLKDSDNVRLVADAGSNA